MQQDFDSKSITGPYMYTGTKTQSDSLAEL